VKLEIKQLDLEINGLPDALKGLKIALIGDLHNVRLGPNNQRLAAEIIKARPDFIFCTGDMFDRFRKNFAPFAELLKELNGQFRVYMCPGNHEKAMQRREKKKYSEFYAKITALGVILLEDEWIELDFNGAKFRLYGLMTTMHQTTPALSLLKQKIGKHNINIPAIVLAHDPCWFDVLADWGADLVLSGHHHGGLIRLPDGRGLAGSGGTLFPKYDWGKFTRKKALMYITRGFGGSEYGLRWNNPQELSLLTLTPLASGKTPADLRLQHQSPIIVELLKCLITGVLLLLSLLTIIPLFIGIINPGVILPTLFSSLFLPLIWRWKFLMKRLKWPLKLFLRLICVAAAAGLLYVGGLSVWMLSAAAHAPEESMTVVVLGGRVYETGPSALLRARLDAALAFLNEYPDARVVVSGGQGANEKVSEAEIMGSYLAEQGIARDRIILEDQSTSTYQNMAFTAQKLAENGLPAKVAVATDTFHQRRAGMFAEEAGLTPYALSNATRIDFFGAYWVREWLALTKALLFGR